MQNRNKHGRFIKGHVVPDEWKENLRTVHKGKRMSKKTEFKKGHTSWNKDKKGIRNSPATEFKKGHKAWSKGKRCPSISERQLGSKNHNWKGGITPEIIRLRKNYKITRWRNAVFQKNNYVCQICGVKGGKLNAHHLLPFSEFPRFRYNLENGITLCQKCHLSIKGKEFLYAARFLENTKGSGKWKHE